MKIAVISRFAANSTYAHAINTVKMAEGFAKCGHDVHLITETPDDKSVSYDDLKTQYGISTNIHWHCVKTFHPFKDRLFNRQVKSLVKGLHPALVYTRSYQIPVITAKMGIHTIAETHAFVGNTARDFLTMIKAAGDLDSFCCISTISETLKEYYHDLGVPADKISVLPDCVDLDLFLPDKSLGPSPYQPGQKNIVYSGHLYDYKGIPTIFKGCGITARLSISLCRRS